MRRRSMSLSSLLPIVLVGCWSVAFGLDCSAQSKPQPEFRITGTLVSSAGGLPIAHGHMVLTPASLGSTGGVGRRRFPAPSGDFETDEHGRFLMAVPSAGAWNVTASARGFVRQAYQEHEPYSTAVVLTREAPTMELRFVLSPEADITGAVLDEAGEPVRRAQVSLVAVRPPGPDRAEALATTRATASTDDRGVYEFAGLAPGDYRVCVQAQPWYAVAAGSMRAFQAPGTRAGENDGPPPDPSLDVTYPLTWFPGVEDQDAAETLTLRAGDTRQADFHLLPMPSIHLLINPPRSADAGAVGRGIPMVPLIQRVGLGAGAQPFVSISFRREEGGQIDVGGLSPGLYQVRVGGPGQETRSSVVKVNAGSAETLDLGGATNEARVTVRIDGLPEAEARSVEVSLIDPETRRSVLSSDRFPVSGNVRLQRRNVAATRTLEVPPGRYEVMLEGRPELYLAGISARGAEARGRMVTLPAGESGLTLHVTSGRATLSGVANFEGKPSVGAMVLLVPATLGDPGAIAVLRRDQSNTDGSFDLPEVIPGQYILVAIDHGWGINWSDASTLRRYLTQGVPLDLTAGANVKQNVAAQAP